MVPHHAGGGDEVDAAVLAGAQTEVGVLETIDIRLVKAAGAQEPVAAHEAAGGGDRGKFHEPAGRGEIGRFAAIMDGIAAVTKHDAGVVEGTGRGIELKVADETRAGLEREGREHGLKPAGLEDEVVVEQREEFALGGTGGAVVGGGIAAVAIVQEYDVRWCEFVQKFAGVVAGAIINEDDLVGEVGGHRGPERSEAGPGQCELVVEWKDEGDLHCLQIGRQPRGCLMPNGQRLGSAFKPRLSF
jgi:hypothetical protein